MRVRDTYERGAWAMTLAQQCSRRVGKLIMLDGRVWEIATPWVLFDNEAQVAMTWASFIGVDSRKQRDFENMISQTPEWNGDRDEMSWEAFLANPGELTERQRRSYEARVAYREKVKKEQASKEKAVVESKARIAELGREELRKRVEEKRERVRAIDDGPWHRIGDVIASAHCLREEREWTRTSSESD